MTQDPNPSPQTPAEGVPSADAAPKPLDWNVLLTLIAPHFPAIIKAMSDGREAAGTRAVISQRLALLTVTGALSGLAALAMWRDHFDTAEKIVIALVSFLAGIATSSGKASK